MCCYLAYVSAVRSSNRAVTRVVGVAWNKTNIFRAVMRAVAVLPGAAPP